MFHEDQLAPVAAPPLEGAAVAPAIWRARDLAFGALLLIAGLGAAGGVAILAYRVLPRSEADPATALALSVITVCIEVWAGVIVLLLARRRGASLRALGFVRPRDWGLTVTAVLGAYGMLVAYGAIVLALERFAGLDLPDPANTIPDTLARTVPVWAVLGVAVVLVAPLGEELFFRGLVYRGVEGLWGPWVGIAVSGVAFSLVHFNPSVVVPFAGIGMVFAWAYRGSGSLWTTIAAHAIFNGVSFAAAVGGLAR